MSTIEVIIIAIIEGLTEFLPVSSTGHMIITQSLLGVESTDFVKAFTVLIQFGALLSVNWMLALSALAVVAVGLLLTQRMSVGSLLGAITFPIFCWFLEPDFIWLGSLMALIVLIKHRANIGRLLRGEEPKMSFKKK